MLLHDVPASSFIAGLLTSDEAPTVCAALQLASVLLTKLLDVFATHFVKEGVVHALRKLAAKHATNEGRGERRRRTTRSRRGEDEEEDAREDANAEAARDPRYPYLPKGTWPAAWETSRLLLEAHFGGDAVDAPLETDGIRALTSLCESLDAPATWGGLCELLGGQGDVRISTFEFLNSGVLEKLVEHLQGWCWPGCTCFPQDVQYVLVLHHTAADTGRDIKGADADGQRLARLHAAATALLPPGSGIAPPALALVRSLQACLSALESLPVPHTAPSLSMPSIFRMSGLSSLGGMRPYQRVCPTHRLRQGP